MTDIVTNADDFLRYGPIGFSALIFVAVIIALLTRGDARRDATLRLIIWVAFGVFCIAAVLAFIPQYLEQTKPKVVAAAPVLNSAQVTELLNAVSAAEIALQKVQSIPPMVANSCSGGSSGVSPANYGTVAQTANDAMTSIVVVNGALKTALTLVPAT